MAKEVRLKHPETGIIKTGLYGFSWTSLFFGGFPAIFRGDIFIGVVVMIGGMLTWGIVSIIWAFIYNKKYTLGLLEKGYRFYDIPEVIAEAKAVLGVSYDTPMSSNVPQDVPEDELR